MLFVVEALEWRLLAALETLVVDDRLPDIYVVVVVVVDTQLAGGSLFEPLSPFV